MKKERPQPARQLDPERAAQIDRWVEYMRTHPNWRKHHAAFINAQFQKAAEFWSRMQQTPEGKRMLRELYGINNREGYPSFY